MFMLQMKSVCALLQRCIPTSFSTLQVSRLNQLSSETDKQGSFQYNCDIIALWSHFAQIINLHPSYAEHHDKNICIYHFLKKIYQNIKLLRINLMRPKEIIILA